MVTSTSASVRPEHNKSTENVSISVGMVPDREIFNFGWGRTLGSDVTIFTEYGSWNGQRFKEKDIRIRENGNNRTI